MHTLRWQAFSRVSAILKRKDIPIIPTHQVYDQCILLTVTYRSETWDLTKHP